MDDVIVTGNGSLSRRRFLALTSVASTAIGVAPTLVAQQPAAQSDAKPSAQPSKKLSPVQLHGQLRTKGNKIIGKDDAPAVLRGVSLFWSQWMGQFYNAEAIEWLRDDWNCSIVRATMGIERGGYIDSPDREKAKICRVVEAAIELGIYVVINWNDHDADLRMAESQEFFADMAKRYGQSPNVIFEIWSEPLRSHDWSKTIKPYHEAVVPKIREHSQNLVVCGTPTWCQDVDKVINDPLKLDNVAYALHFSCGSHKFVRPKAKAAIEKGIPLIVTEWETCESSNGKLAIDDALVWVEFMKEHDLSWCNWAIEDQEEAVSSLLPGAFGKGGWTEDRLTESGKFVRDLLRST